MVHIFYTNTEKQLAPHTFNQLFKQLPPVCQSRINRLVRWQDAQQSLLGLSLLLVGLKEMIGTAATLNTFQYTSSGKPILDLPIQFSITHAGHFSLCAISTDSTVGIDIEEIVDRTLSDFDTQFTQKEWQQLLKKKEPLRLFYTFWTKKEAIVKATGEGVTTNLSLIDTTADHITWRGKTWHCQPAAIHANYVSYLVSDRFLAPPSLKECFFE